MLELSETKENLKNQIDQLHTKLNAINDEEDIEQNDKVNLSHLSLKQKEIVCDQVAKISDLVTKITLVTRHAAFFNISGHVYIFNATVAKSKRNYILKSYESGDIYFRGWEDNDGHINFNSGRFLETTQEVIKELSKFLDSEYTQ